MVVQEIFGEDKYFTLPLQSGNQLILVMNSSITAHSDSSKLPQQQYQSDYCWHYRWKQPAKTERSRGQGEVLKRRKWRGGKRKPLEVSSGSSTKEMMRSRAMEKAYFSRPHSWLLPSLSKPSWWFHESGHELSQVREPSSRRLCSLYPRFLCLWFLLCLTYAIGKSFLFKDKKQAQRHSGRWLFLQVSFLLPVYSREESK